MQQRQYFRRAACDREQVEITCISLLARVSDQVRRLRKAQELRQEDLSFLAGVPQRMIARLEQNREVGRLPLEVVVRLALVLKMDVDDFFTQAEDAAQYGQAWTEHCRALERRRVASGLPPETGGPT
jgi:transcriptional regulator with XRE-family HTH domain